MPSPRWISDCEARNLSSESMRKYQRLKRSLDASWGDKSLRIISVDDVRKLRESWTFSPGTMAKQLELVRSFFSFCESSGWIEKNPAKGVKAPQAKQTPTLPYSESEWRDILTGLDVYGEVHVQSPARVQRQLKALVLLMRYSVCEFLMPWVLSVIGLIHRVDCLFTRRRRVSLFPCRCRKLF